MSFLTKANEKINEKLNILSKEENKEYNEIKLQKRTIENNTHEVIEDTKLKRITSWRKSQRKFLKNLIYNILSLGILHLISLHYPNLYIKLYCNPCQGKDCDFFLVEDIYGYFTLCVKIHKKGNKNKILDYDSNISKETFISSTNNSSYKVEFYLSKILTYSFKYKSMIYEYNEETNVIIPVYMDLSKTTNKGIINYFSDGLSSEKLVMKFKERYGLNEYYINSKILFLYLFKVEIPNFIMILLNSMVEIFLRDYISFLSKFIFVILISLEEYIIIKRIAGNLFRKEYTLDGENNMIRVKRKYLLKDNNIYVNIKNVDLLPGDIIFLKSNDIAPCDCLILDGECIANENNLTGSPDIFKKISIKSNNEKFNYKLNNISILFHGMKIMKTISKAKENFISVLCINTGPNTFKANQYSNILYISEKLNDYKVRYHFFGGERKITFIVSICIFFLCLLLGTGYIFILKMKVLKIKELILSILIRTFCKSLMPTYYLTNNIIILLSIIRLKKENIFCYDKSRLINNSGRIDTIFISKAGTLCENAFEVNSYNPVFFDTKKAGRITYKIYKHKQYIKMMSHLLKYYKEYLNKNINNKNNYLRASIKKENNKYYKKSNEYMSLFLECLLSCNNIDKFNNKIYGNIIDYTIFKEMKWDIKEQDYNESFYSNLNENYSNLNNKTINTNLSNDNKPIFINLKIYDIFPKNYYKIKENSKEEKTRINENSNNKNFNNFLEKDKINNKEFPNDNNSFNIKQNYIVNDILSSKIDSYKLRIYKKFILNGTFNTSAIVYNFMKNELRFMIKGIDADIIDYCDQNSFPENFYKTISYYRRNGFIIIICATKLININDFNDLNGYEFYLNNLTFCGFITLNNKLKNNIKKSMKDLKKFNCNLVMTSGDNEYNCLSVGLNCGIIEDKNIFSFDKDDNNKIIIRKILSAKNNLNPNYDNNNENSEIISNSFDRYSKNNSKITLNKDITTNKLASSKDIPNLKYNNPLYNSRSNKNVLLEKKITIIQSKEKEFKSPKIKHKIAVQSKKEKRRSYLNDLKSSSKKNNNLQNEKLNNSPLNSEIYMINIKEDKLSKVKINNKQKKQYNKIQDDNRNKKSENSFNNYENGRKNSYTKELDKIYYYPGIFKKHDYLIDNCIYCVSGKLLNYLFKNRKNKEYKYLLQLIHKNCKIFFNMSSIDKTISVDFFRKYQNSYICIIGECQSDFDPIMSSNVGINLREPKNFNTILCHFYTKKGDILSITKIIMEGRNIDENISLLRISSYFCTMIINSYILTCFIRNNDVIIGQLNILEIILLIFSILSFTGMPDYKYTMNPLLKNLSLFNCHYYIQAIGLFLMKLITIYFASINYITNLDLQIEKVDKIFCTYYFILSIELIFSIIISFNFISFSKKSLVSKTLFILIFLLLLLYFINLICLNSSNFKSDYFKISFFEYNEELIDSFDDKNRHRLCLICFIDFFATFFYSRIIYNIFYKIAEYRALKESSN